MLKKIQTKKNKEVSIRYLFKEDVKDLLELYNSLVDEKAYTCATEKFTLSQEKLFVFDCLEKIEKAKAIFLVAECEGKVLGIASVEKEESSVLGHRGNFGIILSRELRGEGVGEVLAKAVILEAKKFLKIKIVVLKVFEENKPAVSLYLKLNFVLAGKIEKGLKYFGRYKNELTMVKYL